MTSFFSAEGGPIWIEFHRLMQNDISTAVMWLKSKPDVEFQYGGRLGEFYGMSYQSHVSHSRVLPLGEFTVTIPEPHVTLQGARIPSAIENRFSQYFIIFLFLMQFRQLSYHLRYTCLKQLGWSKRTIIELSCRREAARRSVVAGN